ncbi:ABC transporter permease [Mesorhizobium sp. M7A.F.Ca.US.006.01.1.1]|uniref:ABC transporter permease n=1 Tax=Mesorhizobium sp. M7A.F.Ca.US.006.01.1.1 TaxID=2496707 RepID=UPI000FC99F7A|nr:ABC transporter permease [Mesorhizobium sp. M7A.F.Ca.US.006.01.1.1]RUZ73483.1 ABC transporter permease [Mesorhizobium sp. M7A.F.Ca.US.006.01.1.1]
MVIRTILARISLGLLTLFIVSILVFSAVTMLPGDFATSILGHSATPETVAAFRAQLGLNQPAVIRYVYWLGGILHGDFGRSFSSSEYLDSGTARTVVSLIAPRLWNTLFLAGLAALIATPLSIGLGMLAALYRNSLFDRFINLITLTTISVPDFFVAYILMLFLSVRFNLFHSLSNVTPDTPFLERLESCALPVMGLVLVSLAYMMRMTRASIINLLASPYIEMARLKGVKPSRIIARHALPNAIAPIAIVVAVNCAYLIAGVVVVEVVFVYPGIGQLMVDSVAARDIPVVQACALIFAATYIILNQIADIVSIITNPKMMHPR